MNKCSPVEMRKNLEVVEKFKIEGIDFVAIPVKNKDHKDQLLAQCQSVFEVLIHEGLDDLDKE